MRVECNTVGVFDVNTWLVENASAGECVIIDTGEGDHLPRRLAARNPRPNVQAILLTHAHLDHAGALHALQALYPKAETYLPRLEKPMFESLPQQGMMFGLSQLDTRCGRIDHEVEDGDTVIAGGMSFKFLSTPGHTPGQGCYFTDTDIFVGDTLFNGSIGRTDFPMSDPQLMKESLRRLLMLPGHLIVHSGHGPDTTLGAELRGNPFLGYIRAERGMRAGPSFPW